jgi:membrane-bound lytic murein transglycosylase B
VALHRAVRTGRHRFDDWRGRPSGRFVVPTVVIVAVLAVTGSAGIYLTQAVSPLPAPKAQASSEPAPPSDGDAPNAPPAALDPTLGSVPTSNPSAVPSGRPQEALAAWARRLGSGLGIPAVALQAYGYAALRFGTDQPGCHLAWTTLAAIGKVESDHGRAGGATLQPDGKVVPAIIGPALNGQNGLKSVPDTDAGRYDNDRSYDHAVGPMQFIPGTWQQYATDGDLDGVADPNDIDDATMAAAKYLCAGDRDLATSGGWWGAVLSYNAIQAYARNVFDAANDYGQRSRTIA